MATMMKQIGIHTGGNKKEFQGLSTETRPTISVGDGSTAYEIDTGKAWVYDSTHINPVTSDNWWGV